LSPRSLVGQALVDGFPFDGRTINFTIAIAAVGGFAHGQLLSG